MADNDFMTGYSIGQNENRGNGGLFGSEGIVGLIAILALLGGGMGGFGFGGGGILPWMMMMGGGFGGFGYGNAGLQGMATRADINEGFALNNIIGGITAIQQGLCDTTYALNNAITNGFNQTNMGMMQGFNGVERGFCSLSHQLSDCCCENRAAIADLKYTLAGQTRDVIDANNANTKAVLDFMVAEKLSAKDAQIADLRMQVSQSNQNAVLMAAMDANKAEILRRTGAECPTPCFVVNPPTPVSFRQGCCNNGYANGFAA